jgi:hypothetical protein
MIGAMMRLVRGTPVVRLVLSAFAVLFTLWGAIPLALYPLLRLDAAGYARAITDPGAECKGDPIPARGGCWSAAPARVTITGVDHRGGGDVAYVVVDVRGQQPLRADLVDATRADLISTRMTLTARYWHGDVAVLVLPASGKSAPIALPTRANPEYRAAQLPVGDALTALLGVVGLLVWGVPLLADVRAFRARRRDAAATRWDDDHGATAQTFGERGLARYGIDLHTAPPRRTALASETELTGRRDRPPQTESGVAGGDKGWNIRPQ